MDASKFQAVIRKIGFLKHYSSLLVPVAVTLIGALLFIPTQLISNKLKERIKTESVSKGNQIKELSKSSPARNQWQVEQEYQVAFEQDANQIALLSKQTSQRPLLSYKIFPAPKDTSTLIFEEFGQEFRKSLDRLIARVKGRDCPTDTELERVLKSSGSQGGGRRFSKVSSSNLSDIDATIVDVFCKKTAESASVYVNSSDLSGYNFWEAYTYVGMQDAVKDCWYWQLAYWITEDVIDTIETCNSGAKNVLTSPVKRLMGVSFSISSTGSSDRGKGAAGRPYYVLSTKDELTGSCTGRLSNDAFDVVHFNVVVIVSAKAVLPFMKQLCSAKQHKSKGFSGDAKEQIFKHNQITILKSDILSVDMKDPKNELYRYGEDAVVKLDLICEYIFNKNGYEQIKPESVKESLKGETEKY